MTTHPQLWARIVVPKATRFWRCRWAQESGASGLPKPFFRISPNRIPGPRKIYIWTEKIFPLYSQSINDSCMAQVTADRFSRISPNTIFEPQKVYFCTKKIDIVVGWSMAPAGLNSARLIFQNITKSHIWILKY